MTQDPTSASAPQTSVVIPLYNDAASIGQVLAALDRQTTDRSFEVIVVDDGSTDDGPNLVRPPARLIRQTNAGPAAARNHGAAIARGDALLFLDADCIPPENWLAEMSDALKGPGFDAVMGTLVAANDGLVPRLVQLEIEDRYLGMARAVDGVDFIACPSCGMRRAVFEKVGGFDRRLRQAEDVELAYRLTGLGYRIAFVDTAPVAHAHQSGWLEFLAVKYRRAKGRMQVFRMFPGKVKADTWTPLALKLQFAFIALSLPSVIGALIGPSWLWFAVPACLCLAIASGWPFVRATASRQADLIGYFPGLCVGAAYIVLRGFIILSAVLTVRISAAKWVRE
ncbi:glycosyltransferase [Roseovarius sp. S4756]|uniref:glycosyltransferase n=1 Tax=Roseovarius maritimus TaxID=3342637 RepID=UPI0037284CC0